MEGARVGRVDRSLWSRLGSTFGTESFMQGRQVMLRVLNASDQPSSQKISPLPRNAGPIRILYTANPPFRPPRRPPAWFPD
jgi:hypothetical protein